MRQKFFCDNCGEMVKKDAARCSGCGRYFRSVKCPECGFAGQAVLFGDGCPSCGYAAENPAGFFPEKGPADVELFGGRKSLKERESGKSIFPGGFYRMIILLLTAVLIFLLFWYFRLIGN